MGGGERIKERRTTTEESKIERQNHQDYYRCKKKDYTDRQLLDDPSTSSHSHMLTTLNPSLCVGDGGRTWRSRQRRRAREHDQSQQQEKERTPVKDAQGFYISTAPSIPEGRRPGGRPGGCQVPPIPPPLVDLPKRCTSTRNIKMGSSSPARRRHASSPLEGTPDPSHTTSDHPYPTSSSTTTSRITTACSTNTFSGTHYPAPVTVESTTGEEVDLNELTSKALRAEWKGDRPKYDYYMKLIEVGLTYIYRYI